MQVAFSVVFDRECPGIGSTSRIRKNFMQKSFGLILLSYINAFFLVFLDIGWVFVTNSFARCRGQNQNREKRVSESKKNFPPPQKRKGALSQKSPFSL